MIVSGTVLNRLWTRFGVCALRKLCSGPRNARREEKMTQGWVVYGGMRHAEPQREMFPRS
jgi:hypothetical protein